MFNIGFSELVILAVIALLVVGPEDLPEIARKAARLLNDLRRTKDELLSPMNDLKNDAQNAIDRMRRKMDEEVHQQVSDLTRLTDQIEQEKPPITLTEKKKEDGTES
jgi:sec-independent protein translocase protein TatB